MQQHGSKYFGCGPPPPLPPPPNWVIWSNSEHGHVTYQIKKENHKCSNSVVNILLSDPSPPTLGVKRSKLNLSDQCHVAYQIKGNLECSNMVAYILSADLPLHPHLDPGGGVNRSKFNFFRTWSCCITNYREWSIEHHASTYFLPTRGPSTCGLD